SRALHAHFQLLARQKHAWHKAIALFGDCEVFEIFSFNRFSAPRNRLHCACLVALSSSSDKLSSNDSDRWIYTLVSLSRAAFESLALAVRRWRRIANQPLRVSGISATGRC
ncbi:MAG: hypothetical protein WCE74_28600, partial [Pseudolabrys sp.]